MTIKELCEKIEITCVFSPSETLMSTEITGGIVSDLLSNVMGSAKAGALWITMQAHQNIVAVAALADLAAVIVAGGVQLEPETLHKAEKEQVLLFTTALSAYEITGKLYQLGINGNA